MDAKSCNLGNLIQDFLVAKQIEGKTQDILDFYRQNLQRIQWWLESINLDGDVQQITVQGVGKRR